jgi:hypothetical protein
MGWRLSWNSNSLIEGSWRSGFLKKNDVQVFAIILMAIVQGFLLPFEEKERYLVPYAVLEFLKLYLA